MIWTGHFIQASAHDELLTHKSAEIIVLHKWFPHNSFPWQSVLIDTILQMSQASEKYES